MKNPTKIALALASMTLLSVVLAGCGSGEEEVDPKALNSRNSQRQGAQGGAPPKSDAPK